MPPELTPQTELLCAINKLPKQGEQHEGSSKEFENVLSILRMNLELLFNQIRAETCALCPTDGEQNGGNYPTVQDELDPTGNIPPGQTQNAQDKRAGELTQPDPIPIPGPGLDHGLGSLEIQFFINVWLPCFLVYGTNPASLLRSARQGELESMQKLVRLDPSTIFDPKVSTMVHQLLYTNWDEYKRTTDSLKQPFKGKVSRRKLKSSVAALIKVQHEIWGEKITCLELRYLFNSLARDLGKDINEDFIDRDLPVSDEAFHTAIYRDIPFWKSLYNHNKK